MKTLKTQVNEARISQIGETTLHFENMSAALIFLFECLGQISDGKYENSRPIDHWWWVTKIKCVVDDEAYFEGPRHKIHTYNLNEWIKYIKDADKSEEANRRWGWARRVLDYGRFGLIASKEHLDDYRKQDPYRGIIEFWGRELRKNPDITFKELEVPKYMEESTKCAIWNEAMFVRFKKAEYTMRDLRADLASMSETINTLR